MPSVPVAPSALPVVDAMPPPKPLGNVGSSGESVGTVTDGDTEAGSVPGSNWSGTLGDNDAMPAILGEMPASIFAVVVALVLAST
jgi:hypothetical protein